MPSTLPPEEPTAPDGEDITFPRSLVLASCEVGDLVQDDRHSLERTRDTELECAESGGIPVTQIHVAAAIFVAGQAVSDLAKQLRNGTPKSEEALLIAAIAGPQTKYRKRIIHHLEQIEALARRST